MRTVRSADVSPTSGAAMFRNMVTSRNVQVQKSSLPCHRFKRSSSAVEGQLSGAGGQKIEQLDGKVVLFCR